MLCEAKTPEDALARTMVLDVKDVVQDYIKWEMEEASRIATERGCLRSSCWSRMPSVPNWKPFKPGYKLL